MIINFATKQEWQKKSRYEWIEKGLTAQLTNKVTPIPRQYCLTWESAVKSTFIIMGIIISHTNKQIGKLICANSI